VSSSRLDDLKILKVNFFVRGLKAK